MRVFDRREVVPSTNESTEEIEALKAKLAAQEVELEALRKVENAALAYVPYPAKSFDERHSPLREGLILALANVIKARGEAVKGKASS